MQDEKSIFSVEINEKGAGYLRRIYYLSRALLWLSTLLQLIVLGVHAKRLSRQWVSTGFSDTTSLLFFQLYIYPVYLVLMTILSFIFWVYFVRFSGRAKLSLALNDSNGLNDSLRWLCRCMILSIISLALNALEFGLAYLAYFN